MNGDGRSRPLLQTEPNAHATGATSSATSAVGDAVSELPALSQSTPTKPMPRPSHSRRLERCPRSVANSPIHSGTDATATAASPDDPDCAAMHTMPLTRPSSIAPMKALFHPRYAERRLGTESVQQGRY